MYCACLIVRTLFVALLVVSAYSYSCNSSDSCTALHLNNHWLHKALEQRCIIDTGTLVRKHKTIAFTHIPKCGGSTVHQFLKTYVKDRYLNGPAHEPYPSTLMRMHDTLFYITLLRHPLSLVVSLYQYMMDKLIGVRRELPPNVKNNYLWIMAQRSRNIVDWLNNTNVRHELADGFPETFIEPYHPGIANENYYIAKANFTFPFNYDPYVSIQYHHFLNYTAVIPEPYRCVHHLKVVLLLLQRYEVVGVLEHFTDFWDIVFRRAQLNSMLYEKATSMHFNKSKFSVSPHDKAIAAEMLEMPLYCATVVWEIATMISDQDKSCNTVSNHSMETT